jgi:hypothetical protein
MLDRYLKDEAVQAATRPAFAGYYSFGGREYSAIQ